MILIDDSGWGSLLGGVMIGMYNTETKKFRYKLIPVSYFQGDTFKKKKYLDKATKIFLEAWPSLGDSEYFTICRGIVLDGIYEILINNPSETRDIYRGEIGEPLQSLLEEKFSCHLSRLGVPRNSTGAHCLSFDDQLKWIREDPKRIKYVKTGWPRWKTIYSKSA